MDYPPRRHRQGTWIGSRPTQGALTLLALEGGLFLLYCLIGSPGWVARHLALVPRLAIGPEPWQIITSGLVHLNFSSILFDGISLWIFGTAVEMRVGRARMLTAFASAQVAGALAVALIGRAIDPYMVVAGCAAGTSGLVAAFGVAYDRVPLSLFGVANMRGRTVAVLMIGFSAAFLLFHMEWLGLAGTLTGVLLGWAVTSGLGARVFEARERFRVWRFRRRYKVIPGGRDQKRYLN